MSDPKNKFLQIDEEGYFHSGGVRWEDPEPCRDMISRMKRNEFGNYQTFVDDQPILLEPFDAPLIVHRFEFTSPTRARIWIPYDVSFETELSSLRLDEWDRFHGRTPEGFAFVLTRKAQAQLFEGLDDYDDDSITLKGKTFEIKSWPGHLGGDLPPDYWSERHRTSPGWDLGGPHPSIEKILPQLKLSRCRILVSGAGAGHDAAALARAGHFVTAVDFSDEAISRGKALYGSLEKLQWLKADLLNLPRQHHGQFDLVFEHTCFCAIPPEKRNLLVKNWRQALTDQGQLLAILPLFDKDEGPPFASSEWELRERFKKSFDFLYWSRSRFTPASRLGQELILFAQKKNGAV